ncbi:unnamed protein product [Rotaria magnacalcarata]|uniref:Uncharacterized protein n=1 Tax=Rotaria magnacalcarata TaxID=392030 RepID=A0A816TJ10_9BILA|nr:unnamed protein product [Rotaria magnacalcarata]CAF3932826.1 unnamed protein product [Rotaria magnacalcarata]
MSTPKYSQIDTKSLRSNIKDLRDDAFYYLIRQISGKLVAGLLAFQECIGVDSFPGSSTSIVQLTVKTLENTILQAYSYTSRLVRHVNMYQQHQILSLRKLSKLDLDYDSDSDDSRGEEDEDTTGNCTDKEDSSENDKDYVSNHRFKVISTTF